MGEEIAARVGLALETAAGGLLVFGDHGGRCALCVAADVVEVSAGGAGARTAVSADRAGFVVETPGGGAMGAVDAEGESVVYARGCSVVLQGASARFAVRRGAVAAEASGARLAMRADGSVEIASGSGPALRLGLRGDAQDSPDGSAALVAPSGALVAVGADGGASLCASGAGAASIMAGDSSVVVGRSGAVVEVGPGRSVSLRSGRCSAVVGPAEIFAATEYLRVAADRVETPFARSGTILLGSDGPALLSDLLPAGGAVSVYVRSSGGSDAAGAFVALRPGLGSGWEIVSSYSASTGGERLAMAGGPLPRLEWEPGRRRPGPAQLAVSVFSAPG